jgi:hypothetical protein
MNASTLTAAFMSARLRDGPGSVNAEMASISGVLRV